MLFDKTLLSLLTITSSFAVATPTDRGEKLERVDNVISKRQDADGEDLETEAATDPLRDGKRNLLSLQSCIANKH